MYIYIYILYIYIYIYLYVEPFAKRTNGFQSLTVFGQGSATLFKKLKKKLRQW